MKSAILSTICVYRIVSACSRRRSMKGACACVTQLITLWCGCFIHHALSQQLSFNPLPCSMAALFTVPYPNSAGCFFWRQCCIPRLFSSRVTSERKRFARPRWLMLPSLFKRKAPLLLYCCGQVPPGGPIVLRNRAKRIACIFCVQYEYVVDHCAVSF